MKTEVIAGEVASRCEATLSRCRCAQPPGHHIGEGPTAHACPCGGSWVGEDGADDFAIVTYPERVISPDGEDLGPVDPLAILLGL